MTPVDMGLSLVWSSPCHVFKTIWEADILSQNKREDFDFDADIVDEERERPQTTVDVAVDT